MRRRVTRKGQDRHQALLRGRQIGIFFLVLLLRQLLFSHLLVWTLLELFRTLATTRLPGCLLKHLSTALIFATGSLEHLSLSSFEFSVRGKQACGQGQWLRGRSQSQDRPEDRGSDHHIHCGTWCWSSASCPGVISGCLLPVGPKIHRGFTVPRIPICGRGISILPGPWY